MKKMYFRKSRFIVYELVVVCLEVSYLTPFSKVNNRKYISYVSMVTIKYNWNSTIISA